MFSKKEKLVRTHSLEQLLKVAYRHDADFKNPSKASKVLGRYYTDTRYPDIWDTDGFDNRKLAQEALKLAKEVAVFVEKNYLKDHSCKNPTYSKLYSMITTNV